MSTNSRNHRNTGNLLESEIPSENAGNLLEFESLLEIFGNLIAPPGFFLVR